MQRRKVCAECWKEKPATLRYFVRHKQCTGEIGSYCRPCYRKLMRDWKRKNSERLATKRQDEYRRGYSERHKELERLRGERFPLKITAENLQKGISERVRARRLPVSKELRVKEFIIAWLDRQRTCECCDVPFSFGRKRGIKRDDSPSFDQIVPGAGYLLTNVALICWRCNNIKRNYDVQDLERVANWLGKKRLRVASANDYSIASDYLRGAA